MRYSFLLQPATDPHCGYPLWPTRRVPGSGQFGEMKNEYGQQLAGGVGRR